jgi:hypothetical protein
MVKATRWNAAAGVLNNVADAYAFIVDRYMPGNKSISWVSADSARSRRNNCSQLKIRSVSSRDRQPRALLASRNARSTSQSDSGTRRASGPEDDAAVYAPQPVGD